MGLKTKLVTTAVVFFLLGAFAQKLLWAKYEQENNDAEAYSRNVDLNSDIAKLKDFDEWRIDSLKSHLELDIEYDILNAKIFLAQRELSEQSRKVLSEKVAKAELALKDRSKTLDELLFSGGTQ